MTTIDDGTDTDIDWVRHWADTGPHSPPSSTERKLSDVFDGVSGLRPCGCTRRDGWRRRRRIAPGDDQFEQFEQFEQFTEVDSTTHHEALRRWMSDGVVPD